MNGNDQRGAFRDCEPSKWRRLSSGSNRPRRAGIGLWTANARTLLLAALVLAFLAVESAAPPGAEAQSTSTWSTRLTSELSGGRYGYTHNRYGSVTDRDFVLDGHTYVLYSIRWRPSRQRVELYFDDCIKASEFVSLRLGSSTYSDPDWIDETDETCQFNRNRYQTFHFNDATSNPLPAGETVPVQITMRGNVPPPPPANTEHWDASIGSRKDSNSDHYGYRYSDFGTITDRTFQVSGHTFEISAIRWDESRRDVEIRLNDCLKPAEFVSLRLGTTTLSGPDYAFKTSDWCNDNRDSYQIFRFNGVSTNPLPSGRRVSVRITYSGDAALPPNTATRWSTYLDSVQDNNDDEYGYHASDFGSIDDRTFDFGGTSYTIRYLKWEDTSDDVQLYLNECLKRSEVAGLVLGDRTFSAPNTASRTDATCGSHRSYDQILKWTGVTANPLPAGRRVAVTLNFSDAAPAVLPTVSAPSRPTLGAVTASSIGVSWGAPTGAGSYQVRYRRVSSSVWSGPYAVSSGRTYTASGLQTGTEYEFQVRATGDGATRSSSTWSGWSPSRKATTTRAPGAPTNGSATVDAFDGSLDLSWSAPSGGASTYRVNIASGSFRYSRINIAGTSHSIPGTSLSAISGPQTARVKACSSGGSCGPELSISFRPPPPAPSNLRSTGATMDSVSLSWGSVAGVTGYEHDYRKASDRAWSDVDRSTTSTSRTVGGLECGVEYVFRARAHGNGTTYFRQWGPWSNEARATTAGGCIPSEPREVDLRAGDRRITVTWKAPASNGGAAIDGYRVRYMADDASSWTYSHAGLPDPLSHIVTGLENGTSYDVEVQARNRDAEYGAWSEAETATPAAPPPLPAADAPSVTTAADGVSMHGITIRWPAVSGAAKYQVQHKPSADGWPTVDDGAAGQSALSYSAAGLTAATSYDFRVRAYGNGTTRSAGWGPWSGTLTASTLADACAVEILEAIADTVIRRGTWSSGCESTNRAGRYARHFSFTAGSRSTVTVELTSSTDPYLFLMSGEGTSGTVVARNDDSNDDDLGRLNSRITYEAAPGLYTAEATTFSSGAVGDFTIRIRVAAASPTNSPPAFGAGAYSFSVDEDAAVGHAVGTVAATDSDGSVASYSLDDTSLFSISNAGVISVAASLEGRGDEPPVSLTATATDDDGGTATATVAVTVDDVPPSEPREVVLTPGHAQIRVAWKAPDSDGGADIDGYRVRHRAATASSWIYSRIVAASPYTIESLDNGTAYRVEVQARNSLQPPEFGHWSDFETATPVASTLPVVDAPAAPTKTAATSSSITVSWGAVAGAARYRVRYRTGADDWNIVEAATGTRHTASMLDAAASYRFEVGAYGDGVTRRAAWGAWSAHLDAATDAAPTVGGCTTALGSIIGESSHAGSWTDECVSSNRPPTRYARYHTFELAAAADLTIELVSDEDPYLYLMSGAGTNGPVVASNDDSRDDDLGYYNSQIVYQAAAGTYTAESTAYASRTTGDFTIRIDAAPRRLGAPRNVKVVPGDERLAVLWDPPASDGGSAITGYLVEQEAVSESSGSGGRGRRAVTDPSRLLGADDRGVAILNLSNGTEYSVTVKAVNADGEGAPATATATPAEVAISIGTVHPNPLVVARKATVNVTTSNTVSGVDYSAELVIQDTDKIRFGECDDDRATQPLPNLGSTVRIQGCETGTPTISARLLISDKANRKYTLAESLPRRVTVDAAPERLDIDEAGALNDVFDINTDRRFSVKGTDLLMDTTYGLEIDVTSGSPNPLGVSSGCAATTSTTNLVTGPADTEKSGTFRLYACAPVADGEVTVDLKLDDVVVATATKTVKVRPDKPVDLRANGDSRGLTSGQAKLRWNASSNATTYKLSYGTDCASINAVCDSTASAWVNGTDITASVVRVDGSDVMTYTIPNLALKTLYRLRIAVVENSAQSEWSEIELVYPTAMIFDSRVSASPIIGSIPVNGYIPSHSYDAKICTNKMPSSWVNDIKAAVSRWQEKVVWNLGSSNIITSTYSEKSDCQDLDHTARPLIHPWGEIRMGTTLDQFQEYCNETPPKNTTAACAGKPGAGPFRSYIAQPYIFFKKDVSHLYTGGWMPGVNVSSTVHCSQLHQTALHEVGHAFAFGHAEHNVSVMKPGRSRIYCDPRPHDIAGMMAVYQSHNPRP